MIRRVARLGLLLCLLSLLGGCALLQSLGLVLDPYKPTISFKSMDLKSIDFSQATVDFVFTVDNPNPLAVTASSFTYALAIAGKQLAAGQQSDGITLKANGGSDVALPISVKFADLLSLGQAIKGVDKVGYALTSTFGFTTPVGEVQVPLEHEGDFPVMHKPEIRLIGIRSKGINLLQQKADLVVDLGVANKNGGSSLGFEGFNWKLDLGGKQAANGVLASMTGVEAGKEQVVQLPVSLQLLQLGTVVYNAVVNKTPVDYRIAGNLNVVTPWGKAPLALNRAGNVPVQGGL